MRFLIINFLN